MVGSIYIWLMTFVTIDNENDDMSAAGYVTEGDCSRGVALVCNSAAAEAIGKFFIEL